MVQNLDSMLKKKVFIWNDIFKVDLKKKRTCQVDKCLKTYFARKKKKKYKYLIIILKNNLELI